MGKAGCGHAQHTSYRVALSRKLLRIYKNEPADISSAPRTTDYLETYGIMVSHKNITHRGRGFKKDEVDISLIMI